MGRTPAEDHQPDGNDISAANLRDNKQDEKFKQGKRYEYSTGPRPENDSRCLNAVRSLRP